ncbi:MAG TPA: polyprenyl diphosphate synthase [Candidatus Moranbacteria bacterium]|jgi:undecaprenyl diphosphate synthase|nr:di-trans,poly-cis-decaprenylcistransferase [Candidatus Moranbacteria bacterium]HOF42283.1 polyprenyl diphosphate synthase [Candidatus Moranbacteria bacterium]HPX93993.1 polyprenyl diphosphate synthase [Candidatus Moranbacteria bacterium]HQB59280.1 polyprenyl diphosphate synthase [Candidatus Moranbacteria bacterium]
MSDISSIPNHVAIIPDGNRRWAKQRGLKPWEGHIEGAKNTENLMKKALEMKIKCLSLWGSSLENLKKRPIEEKKALLEIYAQYFEKLSKSKEVHENEVKINFIGKWEQQFPEALKKIIYKCIEATKNYGRHTLNFLLAYSGDDEMKEAIKKIAGEKIEPEDITDETIKNHLMTKDLPPVDYMIRTGGEPHLSAGFMMWDTANAQLYFSEKFYPDFNGDEFRIAIEDFMKRGRRLGK